MIFTKDLLLKGLAGLALCTGTAALGVHYMGGFSSLYGEVKVTEKDLGLPEGCTFPGADANTSTSCNLTAESIKSIKFDGKNATATSLTGTGNLQISIPSADEKDIFPHGYKVTITASSNSSITINRDDANGGNISITTGNSVDFKIKQNSDKTFSLEKAWTAEDLAKKLGLNKEDDGRWTLGAKAIKVKYETGSAESKTASSAQPGVTQGKIKAYAETTGTTYNKGIKFVIEDGDIALTGEGSNITKLEEFETYEINKEGDAWVLVRKTKASEEIKKALVLPANCTMPEGNTPETECALDSSEKLKTINFDGKTGDVTAENSTYSNIKLKISKTTAENKERFSHGFKFVLESDKDITIPKSSGTSLVIKKNTNTEFKIKKTVAGGNTTLTLEKAWTVADLAAKVKLTGCTTASPKQCDFGTSINVYEGENNKVVNATISASDKKINYQEEEDGYNQGIKFTVSENISISGTADGGVTAPTQICNTTGTGTPSYEIKEVGGT